MAGDRLSVDRIGTAVVDLAKKSWTHRLSDGNAAFILSALFIPSLWTSDETHELRQVFVERGRKYAGRVCTNLPGRGTFGVPALLH